MYEEIYFWFHEGRLIKTIFYKYGANGKYTGTVKNFDIHDNLILARVNLGPLAILSLKNEIRKNKYKCQEV
jgi:small nuclear ribonucleoprotein (snRNP)-like protein